MAWVRAKNHFYLGAARARGSHVVTNVEGFTYVVSVDDDGPGRALVLHGTTPELRILPSALRVLRDHGATPKGTWLLDVGANIGTTVIPAVARHEFERAIAIEPEVENVRVLRANLALNRLDRDVEVVEAAASDVPGTAAFRRGKATDHGWRAGAGALAEAGEVPVEVVTLDGLLEERGIAPADVGLVWLDVQGHEGNVLKGAAELLRAKPPLVFASRPRKLAKAGTLEYLHVAIAETYPCIVDLRPETPGAPWAPRVRPAAEISEVVQGQRTTDVLAFVPAIRRDDR